VADDNGQALQRRPPRPTLIDLTREQPQALAIDLSRRSTLAEGGFCTFQPVVDGGACPWKLDCGNCDARAAIAAALAEAGERRVQMAAAQDDEREATWRERALNAEDGLKAAHAEILAQRTRIGELLGQVRDLESEWTKEAIARITTENTTLKQRVRQLTADNRTLEERLQAARSNNRFADRRIAQLEAELADPQQAT
jgi:hypothetical protein